MTRSTGQTTWCAGTHEQKPCVMSNRATALRQRSGFTLIELLVVIGIISVLTALITPAVFNARLSARRAVIKSEIEMLHMAVMNYRNENGSYPPCVQVDNNNNNVAVKHLRRNFPRCSNPVAEFNVVVHPGNALGFWLDGYTGDPEFPITGGKRITLYDFDDLRFNANTYVYEAPNTQGTAYLYFDSGRYDDVNGETIDGTDTVFYVPGPNGQKNSNGGTNPFFDSDGFIILSAGLDGVFYTADDLSNAWKGTWEDYLDSQTD